MKTFRPPYFDIVDLVDAIGYDIIPFQKNGKWRVAIFKHGKFLKEGEQEYANGMDAMRSSYYKIYDAICKK